MDDIKVKKEIIDKIKSSSNILITVSNDPSVDELSAALGLTLALNKMEKHATAIFSGATPPALKFLEPEKTFENNTDSLRDFIIALNREKADHLRFKPDGEYVKIFITPYRSVITPEDLEFSQGDFNVELVITLGVDNKEHLDDALDNHGKILHDATVVGITAGENASTLGSSNWHDGRVSSISEMIAGLIESLKEEKKESIIDGPIATALLTGIVAETERFSNSRTTSGVMTVASRLMNAGADQQLIAFKLEESATEEAPVEGEKADEKDDDSAYTLSIDRDTKEATLVPAEEEAPVDVSVSNAYAPEESTEPMVDEAPVEPESPEEPSSIPVSPEITTSKRAYVSEPGLSSAYAPEADAASGPGFPGAPPVAPGSVSVSEAPIVKEGLHSAYASDDAPVVEESPVEPEQPVAPEPAPAPAPEPVAPTPPQPANPADLGLPMPPPLPDFTPGTPPPALPTAEGPQPERLGDILAPDPPAPVVPEPSPQPQSGPRVIEPLSQPIGEPVAVPQPPASPGQFQIPTQQ